MVQPRLDAKPWGGRRLERYGLPLPDAEMIGEALVTAGDAEIVSGDGAGSTLDAFVASGGEASVGSIGQSAVGGRAMFPLLAKLIDAQENLSIQVHPNDAQARNRDRLGKTEAWYVLAAEPGACLYVGLRDGVSMAEFQEAAARLDGSSSSLLRRIPAVPGSAILIPAGTVHALGAGVMVYEIQQPSDVTYRMDDWGRVDAAGNPREMHLEEGFAVMLPESRPSCIRPIDMPTSEGRRHLLVACRYFALERIALPGGGRYMPPPYASPQVMTVLEGSARLGKHALGAGRSAVLWAEADVQAIEAVSPMVALRAWVPDLPREVPQWARQARLDPEEIEPLSGPLSDIRDAWRTVQSVEGTTA